jgi:hypothetical protein
MRYPVSLIDKLDKVELIHESWNSSLKFDEVVNWILQEEYLTVLIVMGIILI